MQPCKVRTLHCAFLIFPGRFSRPDWVWFESERAKALSFGFASCCMRIAEAREGSGSRGYLIFRKAEHKIKAVSAFLSSLAGLTNICSSFQKKRVWSADLISPCANMRVTGPRRLHQLLLLLLPLIAADRRETSCPFRNTILPDLHTAHLWFERQTIQILTWYLHQ